MDFRVLSVKQPWASLIVAGIKTIENRSWRPPQTLTDSRLLIHASMRVDYLGIEGMRFSQRHFLSEMMKNDGIEDAGMLPRGAIIGSVQCVGVHCGRIGVPFGSQNPNHDEIVLWYDGIDFYGWLLRDAVRFAEPIPVKGRLGLWKWTAPDGIKTID